MAVIGSLKLSCYKSTALLERRAVRPLGPGERLGLWMHLRICESCRAYERQSQVIDRLLEQRSSPASLDSGTLEALILARIG